MMSRKDYIRLARAFARAQPQDHCTTIESWDAWNLVLLAVANELIADNPRFDRTKFITACHA